MLSREEWEDIQEVRPRTPFESKLARPDARLRTDEPLHMVSHSHFVVNSHSADHFTNIHISPFVFRWITYVFKTWLKHD